MAFNVSALTQWIDERGEKEDIIIKPFLADPTFQYFDKFNDVKGQKVKKPILTSTGETSDSFCSTTDSDSTTITQFTIEAFFNNYRQNFCLDELDKYFTSKWHNGDSLSIIDDLLNREVGMKVVSTMKKYLWLNNPSIATLPASYKRFNGLLKQIDTSTPPGNVYTMGASKVLGAVDNSSTESVITVIDALLNKLPEEALAQDLVAFVPPIALHYLMLQIKNNNLFHYKVEDLQLSKYEMVYPARPNLKVVSTEGLSNNAVSGQDNTQKDRIVVTPVANIAVSLDEETLKNSFVVDYDKYHQHLYVIAKYYLGGGVKFFDQIATSKRA